MYSDDDLAAHVADELRSERRVVMGMMMGIEVINVLANVQASYGPHFTMKVWDRAEQIALDAGRNSLELDDMKAALRELL